MTIATIMETNNNQQQQQQLPTTLLISEQSPNVNIVTIDNQVDCDQPNNQNQSDNEVNIPNEIPNDNKKLSTVSSPPISSVPSSLSSPVTTVSSSPPCNPPDVQENEKRFWSTERQSMISNSSDKQPEMDSLLEKLRKGMTELSNQGDDFTKQMWDMYATFEDMISGNGPRDERAKVTLLELSSTSSSSSLAAALGSSKSVINSNVGASQEGDSAINSDSCSPNGLPRCESSEDKTVSDENLIICKTLADTIGTYQANGERDIVVATEIASSQSTPTPTSLLLPDEETIKSIDCNENGGTLTRTSDRSNRRFRPIPTSKGKLLPTRQLAIDKSIEKSTTTTNLGGYQSDSGSNSSLANPLLDTISCLTSSDPYSDSDDYDVTRNKVIHQRARRRCRRMLSDRSIRCSPNHLHSCCSSDADSIGYAGSNSIDSGYKSLCPTPEVPESISNLLPYKVTELATINDKAQVPVHSTSKVPEKVSLVPSNSSSSISAFHRLSNLNARNPSNLTFTNTPSSSVSSLSIKSRDNSTLNRVDHSIASSSSSSVSGSFSSRGGAARLKSQTTEAHLEHLLTLRQSLISAIQKCESSSTSTPTDSRVASPVISSRSTSPASTVIPRTVSNLKIAPPTSTSFASYSSSSSTLDNNQILHQSSIHRTDCSSPSTSKGKRLTCSLSPEPWYSQNNYSPSPSQHQHHNYYSQSRYSQTLNTPQTTISGHQSPLPMTSSSSLSIDPNLITPTQSTEMMGYNQQNYASSSGTTFGNSKSVRFEEVTGRSLTNYPNDLMMLLDCNTIETIKYPIEVTPGLTTEKSISSLTNSSVASIAASGLQNVPVDGVNESGSSSNSLSSFSGTTTNSNSNTDCSTTNLNDIIGPNNVANYNDISSSIPFSSSIRSSNGTFSAKSILKDPICANLRTSIESENFSVSQSIENEIDSLLYGKNFNNTKSMVNNQLDETMESQYSSISKESNDLHPHQQQSTIDDPLDIAYVKMIEEKYRTCNRIKLDDHDDDTFTDHFIDTKTNELHDLSRTNGTTHYQRKSPSNYIVNHQDANRFDSQRLYHRSHHQYEKQSQLRKGSSKESIESKLDPLAKSKISEMAKCMLGILDEIEMKNSIENRLPKLDKSVRIREKGPSRTTGRSRPNSAEFRGSLEMNSGLLNSLETASESSYHSLPEYHIYEEVAYDFMMREHQNRPASPPMAVVRKERSTGRRILPPNPDGSITMLHPRFSSNLSASSSVYRTSLKDLFTKPFDGNNNHRMSSTHDANHLSRSNGRYETELKCFRSSSSSPLSSSRTSTLINQTSSKAIGHSNESSNWRSWGRATEQPKQRGNLYSLFTDPNQRINISRSLRMERNYNQQPTINMESYNQMDSLSTTSTEYGFKNI